MSAKQKIKDLVQAVLKRGGFELTKLQDPYNLVLYERLHDKKTLDRKPFYNVGAGAFWHPHWTNLDYLSEWYAEVQKDVKHYDLMALSPLPIETGTAKIIYTSHTIEHVKEPAVQNLFNEAHRALEPGGILRVTTGPDAITDYRALMAGDSSWFYWDEWYADPAMYAQSWNAPPASVPLAERWLNHVASPLAKNDKSPSPVKFGEAEIFAVLEKRGLEGALDYFTGLVQFDPKRPGNHVSWWSHDKIGEFLRKAGFTTVYRSGFNQSVNPLLRGTSLIDSTHPQMSIYMEAVR